MWWLFLSRECGPSVKAKFTPQKGVSWLNTIQWEGIIRLDLRVLISASVDRASPDVCASTPLWLGSECVMLLNNSYHYTQRKINQHSAQLLIFYTGMRPGTVDILVWFSADSSLIGQTKRPVDGISTKRSIVPRLCYNMTSNGSHL